MTFLAQNGAVLQHYCPGTSQQNGGAERKHRHILDMVRALLISTACPEVFWGEAALTAVYSINLIPSPIIGNQSPHERFLAQSLTIVFFMFLDVFTLCFYNLMNTRS